MLSLHPQPNESVADWLASLTEGRRNDELHRLAPTDADERALEHSWQFWGRPDQFAPKRDWNTWLILAGRGWGKTRVGAEWIRARVESGIAKRIYLIGGTAADVRDVMIEGESGLLAVSSPWCMPKYEPGKRRLTWPNGAVATTFSAEAPRRLRGPQADTAWGDELSSWKYPETWDQMQFGLRLGNDPRAIATTTPRPIPLIRKLLKDNRTAVTRGTTFDNIGNLASAFIQAIREKYEGTRLGRQELNAELLEDTPGALWTLDRINLLRVGKAPAMKRVVVAVDPAASSKTTSDETGIIVAGLGLNGHGYVLADLSGRYSPNEWARKVVDAYELWDADRIIAEVNNGGEMVEATLRTVDRNVSYRAVHASRGKRTRAEPVAALDEQARIHHVGVHAALEDQLVTWDSTSGDDSPDRLDARVWAFTELMLGGAAAEYDADVLKNLPKRRM